MDALELKQTLLTDMATGLRKSVEERTAAANVPHAHYLTGRIETLRNIVEFLLNLQVDVPVTEEDKPKEEAE